MKLFILDGKTPVPCRDLRTWGRWMQRGNRIVGKWTVGHLVISTVFLGLNHQFGDGPPLLFETMIFDQGETLDYQTRCSTWDQAEAMHERGIAWAEERVTAAAALTEPSPGQP